MRVGVDARAPHGWARRRPLHARGCSAALAAAYPEGRMDRVRPRPRPAQRRPGGCPGRPPARCPAACCSAPPPSRCRPRLDRLLGGVDVVWCARPRAARAVGGRPPRPHGTRPLLRGAPAATSRPTSARGIASARPRALSPRAPPAVVCDGGRRCGRTSRLGRRRDGRLPRAAARTARERARALLEGAVVDREDEAGRPPTARAARGRAPRRRRRRRAAGRAAGGARRRRRRSTRGRAARGRDPDARRDGAERVAAGDERDPFVLRVRGHRGAPGSARVSRRRRAQP